MKSNFKRILSVLLVAIFIATAFSVCCITAAAESPKIYMRYPGGKTKAFTMSFDDGRVNDRMLIEVFQEYDLKSTFYLNSGNFGKGSTLLTESAAVELYKNSGMEVASHTTNHKDLPTVYKEQGNAGLKTEILDDIAKLESLFGNEIYGIAYPGAPPYEFNSPEVIQYLKDNGVGYARSLHGNNKNFEIPDNWYVWEPTCQINSEELGTYTRKFVDKKVFGDPLLYYVWGHEYDVSTMQSGYMLGTFCEQISGQEDIWYATNGEVYSYIKDYEKIQISASNDTIKNPTNRSLWISCNRKSYEIKAGATVKGILSGTYAEPSEQTSSIKEESKVSSSSKKSDTNSKKTNSSKDEKTSSVESNVSVDVDVNVDAQVDDTQQDNNKDGIMQYMWLLIAVAAVVVIALLVVIFMPQIKKLFKK